MNATKTAHDALMQLSGLASCLELAGLAISDGGLDMRGNDSFRALAVAMQEIADRGLEAVDALDSAQRSLDEGGAQ